MADCPYKFVSTFVAQNALPNLNLRIFFRSSRKDTAKDHMRRRHKNLRGLQILTVPLDDGYSEGASSPGLEISSAPIALDLISPAHFINPELDASFSPFSQSPSYYPEGSPVSWDHIRLEESVNHAR